MMISQFPEKLKRKENTFLEEKTFSERKLAFSLRKETFQKRQKKHFRNEKIQFRQKKKKICSSATALASSNQQFNICGYYPCFFEYQ